MYFSTSDILGFRVDNFRNKILKTNIYSDCLIFIEDILCKYYTKEIPKCDYMFENFQMVKDNDFYLDNFQDVFFTTYRIKGLKE